jgi:hypothetical protein
MYVSVNSLILCQTYEMIWKEPRTVVSASILAMIEVLTQS